MELYIIENRNCFVINYLDLETYDCLTDDDSYKWICKRPE